MVSINSKDPLFTNNHVELVNILDFNPKNINIEKVADAINDDPEYIYYVK